MRVGRTVWLVATGLWALGAVGCFDGNGVLPVYLTWSDPDTSTTLSVHYHTDVPFDGTHVYYDTQSRDGDVSRYAHHATGWERTIEGVDRTVHVTELEGLSPGTTYYFVAGDPRSGFFEERKFRTIPDDGSPLRFVVGGDMSTGLFPRSISWRAARQNPDFALIGGDLAYASGRLDGYERWKDWFGDWEATMTAPDGRLIPLVVAVGNEDVNRTPPKEALSKRAPYYFGFFHQSPVGKPYFLRRFGRDMALLVLDSGHLMGHGPPQRDWLEGALRGTSATRFRFALYHVGLYPAVHDFDMGAAVAGRDLWLPLFDAFELTAAFEHHGHAHKRTYPLRGGRVVPDGEGTVYLGEGCWGKSHVRDIHPERPYLAQASARRHFWLVTLDGDRVEYTAITATGSVIDRYAQTVGTGSAPTQYPR